MKREGANRNEKKVSHNISETNYTPVLCGPLAESSVIIAERCQVARTEFNKYKFEGSARNNSGYQIAVEQQQISNA